MQNSLVGQHLRGAQARYDNLVVDSDQASTVDKEKYIQRFAASAAGCEEEVSVLTTEI